MWIRSLDDGIVLEFERAEGELLVRLFGDTAEALQPGVLADDDPVAQRLFPAAYRDDARAEQSFRELTESALRQERVERAERCTAEMASARTTRRRGLEVILDDEAASRWMRTINDVRLALGTRLGITEDDDHHQISPDTPDAGSRFAYAWLTDIQDSLVHALMA
jgi:hypothetical protein